MFDDKNEAWVLEINSGPSLGIHGKDELTDKKKIQELDLHVKKAVVEDAIRIAS